ncbi:unnamed protein product [Protopolystoma xenopodis]|uniref:Uncharacterized protein n=1 Tax=Protopolystoma xenopodis TaxID=117903 RepID=A0A3S5A0X3_9PLAT|nr:unnamed protein product [Protopolystoma xenopodis]
MLNTTSSTGGAGSSTLMTLTGGVSTRVGDETRHHNGLESSELHTKASLGALTGDDFDLQEMDTLSSSVFAFACLFYFFATFAQNRLN